MRRWLILATLIVIIDQVTKYFVMQHFVVNETWFVNTYFNLVRVHNTGAAFSFLADAGGWQRIFFISISLIAVGWILWLMHHYPKKLLFCFALGMVLGGAIGNLIDRIIFASVVDFIQVHYEAYFFPAFNMADSAITGGAGLLIWDGFKSKSNTEPS